MNTNCKELTTSAHGNIIPYNALQAILYHPLIKYLFRGKPSKWLPIGLVTGLQSKPKAMYALMANSMLLMDDPADIPVINVPVKAVELTHINDNIIREFQMLSPATRFSEGLPQPFLLEIVDANDLHLQPKLWETLAHLIDYIDCILFYIPYERTGN